MGTVRVLLRSGGGQLGVYAPLINAKQAWLLSEVRP